MGGRVRSNRWPWTRSCPLTRETQNIFPMGRGPRFGRRTSRELHVFGRMMGPKGTRGDTSAVP